jgi:GAF domain-containing protein
VPGPIDVAAALAQATRDLNAPQDLDETLHTIVTVARDSMAEIDHAGISLARRGGPVVTRAATDQLVLDLDRLQYEVGDGPCLHAINADTVVRVEDARHEQRWPGFIPQAVRLGLRSQLGVRLHADDQVLGALNLYSMSSDTISDETEQMAELFAAHVALALGHARRIENLSAALESRRVIGLALGLVMQRLELDEDTAFAYLTRVSATTETKLRDVAASIVTEHHARVRGEVAGGGTNGATVSI